MTKLYSEIPSSGKHIAFKQKAKFIRRIKDDKVKQAAKLILSKVTSRMLKRGYHEREREVFLESDHVCRPPKRVVEEHEKVEINLETKLRRVEFDITDWYISVNLEEYKSLPFGLKTKTIANGSLEFSSINEEEINELITWLNNESRDTA